MIRKIVTISLALGLSIVTTPVLVAAPSMATTVTYSIPTGLKTVDQTPSSVELAWNAVADAPMYRVQYSMSPDFSDPSYVRSLEKTATVDMRGLKADTTYYFRVRVITTDGAGLSDYGPTITGKTLVTPPAPPALTNALSVATYNVHCANCDSDPAKSWSVRRDSVIANVKSRMPDVIGVQEASQGWLKDENGNQINLSQFEDFRNRLNAAGAPYEVTNANRNNCVNSATPVNCVYADQGASQDSKIFYNKNTVTLISQGSALLPSIPGDTNTRYVSWASFTQKSTGKHFFFTDTHLDPRSGTAEIGEEKRQQAEKIVQVIAEKNTSKFPVIITGDMNSSKWTLPNGPYNEFTKAGYIDPTGGTQSTTMASGYAVSENTINGRFNSFNGFNANIDKSSSDSSRALGTHIDYIFTSKMRVASWEMVLNVDANDVIQGPIPSDHNMIVAKVGLPDVTYDSPTTTPTVPTASSKVLKAIDTAGKLWSYSTPGNTTLSSRTEVQSGWGTAKQILSVDWNSDGILDIVTRWGNGSLTMHQGTGGDAFAAPITIGSAGWQNYDLTATKLRTTDKYPGLVARNTVEGNLYYYSNPSGAAHGSRTKIGSGGWTPMSEINAMDWDKDGKMDLIVRNPAGQLLLYKTDGAGNILDQARPVVDYGWEIFESINIIPDFAAPGSVGYLAQTPAGELSYYPIADGKFGAPTMVGLWGWNGYTVAAGTVG